MCTTTNKPEFVQIHMHTSASNLDGAAKGSQLVQRAKDYGHKALAITDHGSPVGLFSHYNLCKKAGIRPILGLEFYITNDLTSRVPNKNRILDDRDYHQSIFIKDKEGYKNFNYLTYVSYTDGYYYKPRIDFDLLFSKSKGLAATSSCMASKINQLLTADRIKEAEDLFLRFRACFGDDFYGEIQFNELNDKGQYGIDQRSNNKFIIDMCEKYDVPVMIGGDVHYLDNGDAELQDAIINSKRQAKEGEEGFQIHARHLYYHGVEDYYDFNKKFGYNYDTSFLERCFENSVKFSEKFVFEFETGKYHLPKIKMEAGMTSDEYIEKVTWDGLIKNIEVERKYFPDEYTNEDIDRLEKQTEYELDVFKNMGLSDYMLMVYDIIKFEKENNLYVAAGRGCFLPGSMVTLSNGLKVRIEDVKIGDKVGNYFSGEGEVSNTFNYDVDEEMVELEFENGKKISCTKDHEIYTSNRGWIKADELIENDNIQELE